MKNTNWNYFYSSVKGTSHMASNTPKQDNCLIKTCEINNKNYLLAAVADGAGSAKYSDKSSKLICELFLKKATAYLKRNKLEDLTRETIAEWFLYFQKILNKAVKIFNIESDSIREFATTFLFSILSDDYNIFVQIGDGIIAVNYEDELECVFLPQNGEYLNTTRFATEENAEEIFMFSTTDKKIKQIAIHTDGIEQIAFDFKNQKPHKPFFMPFFSSAEKMENTGYCEILSKKSEEFLSSEKVNKKTDDDKTLFVAVLTDTRS